MIVKSTEIAKDHQEQRIYSVNLKNKNGNENWRKVR